MSFLGGLFESDDPDEKYVDDQAVQEDHRDNKYVGPAIDTACTVYDSMFDALKFVIRGKANVIENLDKIVEKLDGKCKAIVEKYKEILAKLNDVGAALSVDLSLDIARDALDLLNSNPVLRRYIGEANYWALWDTLAVLAGQGSNVGGDVATNLKEAIKGTIYALLSMTNGLMHFESYIAQITQFWGFLYSKEIPLPLTDSICPQVTCRYYYKPAMAGNPVPGPANYAAIPVPVFDYVNSTPEAIAAFRYNDPDTWGALTPQSRIQFQKARAYWKSNYTNAYSANTLLSGVTNFVTDGNYQIGFGERNRYEGGAPLQVGSTFHQLDTDRSEGFPAQLLPDNLAEAFAAVDAAYNSAIQALGDAAVIERRNSWITDVILANGGDPANYMRWAYALGHSLDPLEYVAETACEEIAATLPEFHAYALAVAELSRIYRSVYGVPYNAEFGGDAPLLSYLLDFYSGMAEEASLKKLKDLMDPQPNPWNGDGAPYGVYTDSPQDKEIYRALAVGLAYPATPFYSAANDAMASEMDVEDELGLRIDGGREPLYAAFGVYGDLKGLYPWKYEVLPLDAFKSAWTRIKGSFHIYYRNDDPATVIFADRIIQAGMLKYIAVCRAAASDSIRRGSEEYTAYIFPNETCSVYTVPPAGMMFGTEFPSFASIQRVDAVSPSGEQYMYDLTRNVIPRYPKYVDPEKWSVMDLIHELWLLADALTPLCGDGGRRKAELNDLLNQFGLKVHGGTGNGPEFIGQLPTDGEGKNVALEFTLMSEFASRIRKMIDEVYSVRDEVLAATRNW